MEWVSELVNNVDALTTTQLRVTLITYPRPSNRSYVHVEATLEDKDYNLRKRLLENIEAI